MPTTPTPIARLIAPFAAQDALKFPLIGSAVLLGLFVVFKLFDRDLVNLLLTAYFVVSPVVVRASHVMS